MTNILEGASRTSVDPRPKTSLPFKKLAQSLIKELKRETLVVEGKDIAPNLYTILISAIDNAVMSRYYGEFTRELQSFLENHARDIKLAFEERPLVRFIVDDKLKAGRYFVIVENVSPFILGKLRREEESFLNGKPLSNPSYGYQRQPSHSLELSRPLPLYQDQLNQLNLATHEAAPTSAPELSAAEAAMAQIGGNAQILSAYDDTEQGSYLIHTAIGRKFLLNETQTIIGRDGTQADITVLDSNISRCHARIFKDGNSWILQDMNSTNGSFVNGQRIRERELVNGDHIVLGSTEFSFKEL